MENGQLGPARSRGLFAKPFDHDAFRSARRERRHEHAQRLARVAGGHDSRDRPGDERLGHQ